MTTPRPGGDHDKPVPGGPGASGGGPGLAAGALIFLVRLYQATLSRLMGGRCRFLPTCSDYFIEAVAKKGAARGMALGVWRILRCNPFCKGGYDPVR